MALSVGVDGRIFALPRVRGLVRYATNLLDALVELGDIELIVFCLEEPVPGRIPSDAEVEMVAAEREVEWHARALPQAVRRAGVDVFHAPADRGLPWRK